MNIDTINNNYLKRRTALASSMYTLIRNKNVDELKRITNCDTIYMVQGFAHSETTGRKGPSVSFADDFLINNAGNISRIKMFKTGTAHTQINEMIVILKDNSCYYIDMLSFKAYPLEPTRYMNGSRGFYDIVPSGTLLAR